MIPLSPSSLSALAKWFWQPGRPRDSHCVGLALARAHRDGKGWDASSAASSSEEESSSTRRSSKLLLQPCLILSGLWFLSPMYIGCLLAIPAPSSARKSLDIGTGRPHNGFELWAFQSQVGNLLLQGIKND